MSISPQLKRKLKITVAVLVVLGAIGTWFTWLKFFREEPEPTWANQAERFKYGSIGAEANRGLPYYIWLVMPRVFPEYLPGPGGYKSFGLVWEDGHEMPVGFTKRTIGFARVANNCAICHVASWRARPEDPPTIEVAGPANTVDVQGLIRFLYKSGSDARFNADTLLAQIDNEVDLSFVDRLIYRYLLIPLTKKQLVQQKTQFAWMDRPNWPQWCKGRDDPMNLTKYFMTSMATDDSTGQADFPSIWNLQIRKGEQRYLNWSGDTPAVRSVLIDSALGLGSAPDDNNPIDGLLWRFQRRAWFLQRMEGLDNFLSAHPAPKYPSEFQFDPELARTGAPIYARLCAECHDPLAAKTNRLIALDEIKTDVERVNTWTQPAADEANRRVKAMGIDRPDMLKQVGYLSPPLDGVWLRAPYLHNGSVPNLRELLEPAAKRSKTFYRGSDLYDPVNVGFACTSAEVERGAQLIDTAVRGDGNGGHEYGTTLAPAEKNALIEYLKTL